MNYFITRHSGALQWLQCHSGLPARHLTHLQALELDELQAGDVVMGTLPVTLIAEINRLGARYLHLQINVPPELRGQELSASQLEELGAELVEYIAFQPLSDDAVLMCQPGGSP